MCLHCYCNCITERSSTDLGMQSDNSAVRSGESDLYITGRYCLDLWRLLRHEVSFCIFEIRCLLSHTAVTLVLLLQSYCIKPAREHIALRKANSCLLVQIKIANVLRVVAKLFHARLFQVVLLLPSSMLVTFIVLLVLVMVSYFTWEEL